MPQRIPPRIGEAFNDWTVVGDSTETTYPSGTKIWRAKVQCSCGFQALISEYALRTGRTKRCRNCCALHLIKVDLGKKAVPDAWTILGEGVRRDRYRRAVIQCKCGRKFSKRISDLSSLNPLGCGKCANPVKYPVGACHTIEYSTWSNMLARCKNRQNKAYSRYGGRGVTVCDRWDPDKGGSFNNFLADVGQKPGPDYQLDKEAVDPNNTIYGPGLVKWVKYQVNTRRRRNAIWVVYSGEKMPMAELAVMLNIDANHLRYLTRTVGYQLFDALSIMGAPTTRKDQIIDNNSGSCQIHDAA